MSKPSSSLRSYSCINTALGVFFNIQQIMEQRGQVLRPIRAPSHSLLPEYVNQQRGTVLQLL